MNIDSLEKLNNTPQEITFAETIAVIEDNYNFAPTAFENGLHNGVGENSDPVRYFLSPNCRNCLKKRHCTVWNLLS
jgi:hypothetical protein